jgi:hypothetical protein
MGYVLGDFSEAPVPLFQSFMDEGGSDTGLSTLPDLNATPSPEPEPGPEPEAPAPAEEELLIRNREKVKDDLRGLLQIGYEGYPRPKQAVDKILQDLNLDSERDAAFLERLRDQLTGLCDEYNGSQGPRRRFDKKGLKDLKTWIWWKKKENY